MAKKTIDMVLDFVLEHYVTSAPKADGARKKRRVYRSELSKEAAQVLLQYLTGHGMTEDEAVSHLKTRFNTVLATQAKSFLGIRPRTDSSRLYLVLSAAMIILGVLGLLFPMAASTPTFYAFMLLMGLLLLWTGLDPLPPAMTKFWKEQCQDADGMTLRDVNALHDLVIAKARKGTLAE